MQSTKKLRPPNKEIIWENVISDGEMYVITSTVSRDKYFLYCVGEGGVLSKRLASAPTPPKLKEFIAKERTK